MAKIATSDCNVVAKCDQLTRHKILLNKLRRATVDVLYARRQHKFRITPGHTERRVCVCVCACVRACVRACACACVCACSYFFSRTVATTDTKHGHVGKYMDAPYRKKLECCDHEYFPGSKHPTLRCARLLETV